MKIKIGTQLIFGFTFAVIVAVIIGFIGITNMKAIDDADTRLYQQITVPLTELGSVQANFHQVLVNLRDMIRANDPAVIEQKAARIDELSKIITDNADSYEKTLFSDEGKKMYRDFLEARNKFRAHFEQIKTLATANRDTEAYALIDGAADVSANAEQAAIDLMVKSKIGFAKQTADENTVLANRSSAIMITVMVIGALIAFILGIFLSLSISNIIKNLIAEVNKLAETVIGGKLTTRSDTSRINWEFRPIMEGINQTLDALVGFFDNMPAPAMIINKEYEILYMNKAGASLGNTTGEQLASMKTRCYDFFKTADCRTQNCACSQAMQLNHEVGRETDAHPGSLNLDIQYIGVPVKDQSGRVVGALEIVSDQTAIKQAGRIAKKISDFQEVEINKLRTNLEKLAVGDINLELKVGEADKDTKEVKDNFENISKALGTLNAAMIEIVSGAKAMAAGDLTVSLKARSDKDELMKALINMITNIRTMVQKIVESADQIAASSEELSKTAQNLSEGSQKQAASLEETSSSMEEMSSSVEQVANKAQNQASSVEEVTSSMEELNASIKGVADLSVKVKSGAEGAVAQAVGAEKSSEETNAAMKKIEESSVKISKIINVISDIADQTNLLALNASIEAARAGDAGRGFAVVAKEISKLADKSAGATKEIGDLITETNQNVKNGAEMVKVVDGAIKKIREVSQESAQYGAEMANATEEQLTGSKQIAEAIQNVNTLAQSIASSAEEQSSTSNEMGKTIEKVNEITQHAASSAEEMASSTEELSSQAEVLKKLAAQFKI